MIRKMLVGALLLVALFAAPASAQYDFVVGPGEVTVGGDVSVSGEGCSPGAEVTITLTQVSSTRAIGDSVVVATVIADENGEFNVTFQIPEGTALGRYEVAAFCDGEQVGSAFIDVVAPGGPGDGTGTIVQTGSDLNGLALLGVGLLTAGGIVLLVTKGRRNEARA